MQRATTLKKKKVEGLQCKKPERLSESRAQPGMAFHPSSGEEPAWPLALGHEHGIISLPARNGNTIKSKKALYIFPTASQGNSNSLALFSSIFFRSGFPYLGLKLIWHAAPMSWGQEDTCFYDAVRGSHSVLFWEPQ